MVKRNWKEYLLYIPLVLLTVLALFPLVWTFVSSFQTDDQIFENLMPFNWKAFLPLKPTLAAYERIFVYRNFGRALFNSFLVTIVTLAAGIIFNSMCAFGFAAFKFKGRDVLFFLVLITFMIPFGSIALPLYLVIRSFNWIDTYWALIIPMISNGITIFLFRQFFLEIPQDYVDACKIDGASWWKVYISIYMGLSIPVIISAGLIIFIFQWEAFLWPLIVARSPELKVIQVAIADFTEQFEVFWSEIFAACSLAVLIPVCIILPLQRYYIQGVTGSGLKG
jgi:multiple sugar transport system permease protein